jgi:hypothetical protein
VELVGGVEVQVVVSSATCRKTGLPAFPVELVGADKLYAALLNESRTGDRLQRSVQEIRLAGYLSLDVSVSQP